MSSMAKSARDKMKAKALRLVGSSNSETPFYPQGEKASDKVGMRPISVRQYKKGGKVVGKVGGKDAAVRADRVARKAGGRIQDKFANVDQKEANKERKGGKDHIGGYKKGGKIKKAGGGELPDAYEAMNSAARLKEIRRGADGIGDQIEKGNNKISPQEYRKGNTGKGEYALKKGGKVKAKKAFGGPSGRLPEQVGKNQIDEMKNMQQYNTDSAVNAGGPAALMLGSTRKSGGRLKAKDKEETKKEKVKKSFLKADAANVFSAAAKMAPKSPRKESKMVDQTTEVEPDGDENEEVASAEDKGRMLKKGGRVKKYGGGALSFGGEKKKATTKKGDTNIILVLDGLKGKDQQQAQQPSAPSPRHVPPAPPQGAGGPPQVGPGGPPQIDPSMLAALGGAGGPPMPQVGPNGPPQVGPNGPLMRKSGGRVNDYKSLKAGSGSGLGRLKKMGLSMSRH